MYSFKLKITYFPDTPFVDSGVIIYPVKKKYEEIIVKEKKTKAVIKTWNSDKPVNYFYTLSEAENFCSKPPEMSSNRLNGEFLIYNDSFNVRLKDDTKVCDLIEEKINKLFFEKEIYRNSCYYVPSYLNNGHSVIKVYLSFILNAEEYLKLFNDLKLLNSKREKIEKIVKDEMEKLKNE
jgi:hypothetical protein